MAVNSGSSLAKVQNYVKQNRIRIPLIADVDRSLERNAGLSDEVSLRNIWQARVIKADGSIVRASASDLESALEKAADGAQWNLNPKEFPTSMKLLWKYVEFADYSRAAKALKKRVASGKPPEKVAAQKLLDYVDEKMKSAVADAGADINSQPWEAWQQFWAIKKQFAGYEIPSSVATSLEKLNSIEVVQNERAALKQLDVARRAARKSSTRKRAFALLLKLVERYPDTEAAETARRYLEKARRNG